MNLLSSILNKSKKVALDADLHENVFVNSIDISEREKRGGGPSMRTLFIEFVKVNPETGVSVGAHEVSWFKLDYTSDYIQDNILEQLGQLVAILDAHMDKEEVNKKFDVLESCDIDSVEKFEKVVRTEEGIKNLSTAMGEKFFAAMEEFIGPFTKETKLLRVKFVYDKNGKYIQAPRFGDFAESMEVTKENSILKITGTDKANKAKASALAEGAGTENASIMTDL